jgi:hypothetical protein
MTSPPRASPRPVLWLALILGAAFTIADGVAVVRASLPARGAVSIVELLLVVLSCLGAAAAFGRGDHQRRAWVLLALSDLALACVYVGDVLDVPEASFPGWYLPSFTVLSNLAGLAGIGSFAATWLRTGLPPPGTRLGRWLTTAVLLAASTLVVGPGLVQNAGQALRGDAYAGSLVLADLSDVVVLLMVATLFRTARALAGGSLAWPFGLMAAGSASWLLFDGLELYAGRAGLPPQATKLIGGALQAPACVLLAAAAFTQRRVIRAAARGAARA